MSTKASSPREARDAAKKASNEHEWNRLVARASARYKTDTPTVDQISSVRTERERAGSTERFAQDAAARSQQEAALKNAQTHGIGRASASEKTLVEQAKQSPWRELYDHMESMDHETGKAFLVEYGDK